MNKYPLLTHIGFLLALTFLSTDVTANRLDELSSFCSGRAAYIKKARAHSHKPSRHSMHKKIRHRCKKRRAYAKAIPIPPVPLVPEVIVEPEFPLVLQRSPRACFKKLLRGDRFAVDYLPPCLTIFANDEGIVSLQPVEGLTERYVPVVNIFYKTPGCYIACYSRNPDKGVYPVTPGIFLVGHIRVKGSYQGVMCVPEDYESQDIRGETPFKEICSKSFSCIGNSCWAGPHTGQLFGLE